MSKEAKAYHHKWIGDEKDLRDRYEVIQDYAENYHKKQLLLNNVSNRRELLIDFRNWWFGNRHSATNISNNEIDEFLGN
jgi:hypothetical protein